MLLRTANSSFIFDLRRRSMRLWAVFLAIFLPAALVAGGCFFLLAGPAEEVAAGAGGSLLGFLAALEAGEPLDGGAGTSWGFIWMILRERVGGGGRVKCSLGWAWAEEADERRRDLGVSLG